MADVLARARRSTPCSTTREGGGRRGSPAARSTPRAAAARRPPAAASGACCRSSRGPPSGCRLSGYDVVVVQQQRLRPRRAAAAGRACTSATATRPFRYAWHERERALAEAPRAGAPAAALRCSTATGAWDLAAARRVTRYIANSRDHPASGSSAIYGSRLGDRPPAGRRSTASRSASPRTSSWSSARSSRHKRVEVALEAAPAAPGVPIKVVGAGPSSSGCRRLLRRRRPSSSAASTTQRLAEL